MLPNSSLKWDVTCQLCTSVAATAPMTMSTYWRQQLDVMVDHIWLTVALLPSWGWGSITSQIYLGLALTEVTKKKSNICLRSVITFC